MEVSRKNLLKRTDTLCKKLKIKMPMSKREWLGMPGVGRPEEMLS